MTRLERSESQNIAEAAAPREEEALAPLLLKHRRLALESVYIERVHTMSPQAEDWDEETFKHGIGQPWSHRMNRYVGCLKLENGEWVNESYGAVFPWVRAYREQWRMCRGVHHEHADRKEFRGSLCRELVSRTVIGGLSLEDAAARIGLADVQRASLVLVTALRWIDATMQRHADARARRELYLEEARKEREQATGRIVPAHVHRSLDGLHRIECENPVCRDRRAA